MRYTIKEYKIGETRIKKRFLFLPKKLNNEIRWLEFAEIVERRGFNFWYEYKWGNK